MDIWVVKSEDTENIEFNVYAFINEHMAYKQAADWCLNHAVDNFDEDSSAREEIINLMDGASSVATYRKVVRLFNDYQSDGDYGYFYNVEKLEVEGAPFASAQSSEVKYIPNPNGGNGCTCKKCGNFSEFAGPNYSDGSFMCTGCRLWERLA